MGTAVVVALTALIGALAALVTAWGKLLKALIEIKKLQAELGKTNSVVRELGAASGNPQIVNAARALPIPDGGAVMRWANEHRVTNPWDMGPKNWERCLFDLGYPGGRSHQLVFNEDGTLKYQ